MQPQSETKGPGASYGASGVSPCWKVRKAGVSMREYRSNSTEAQVERGSVCPFLGGTALFEVILLLSHCLVQRPSPEAPQTSCKAALYDFFEYLAPRKC